MIRKNIKTGEEIYINEDGNAFIISECMGDVDYFELKNFCITNNWKKKIYDEIKPN